MTTDTKELRRLAEAALIAHTVIREADWRAVWARYHTAANPDTILALLDRLDELEAQAAAMRDALEAANKLLWDNGYTTAQPEVSLLETALKDGAGRKVQAVVKAARRLVARTRSGYDAQGFPHLVGNIDAIQARYDLYSRINELDGRK